MSVREKLGDCTEEEVGQVTSILSQSEDPLDMAMLKQECELPPTTVQAVMYHLVDRNYVKSSPDWGFYLVEEPANICL